VGVRVHVVDPSAFTPPYDHALCAALAARGLEVVLETSAFPYAAVPPADGYERRERFYRRGGALPGPARFAAKLAQHAPGMVGVARRAKRDHADVVHFQWLAVQHADRLLLPRGGLPLVLTAHDVLPREPRAGQLAAQKRLYHAVDAVVVHSQNGRERLMHECDLPGDKISVIPHGAFTRLADIATTAPALPPEFADAAAQGLPVVVFYGLLREYKGLDVLLEAWKLLRRAAPSDPAELWIAGMPRMDTGALHAAAREAGNVRFAERFIGDQESAALLQRADVVVLPYREIEQSGVLFSAMGMGKPMILSAVGGFPEVAAEGAATLVPPGDPSALATTIARVLGAPAERERLAAGARGAAAGRYAWSAVAEAHEQLYRRLARRPT
jgi:glycosyltransferase involved in cell wall biosynthesis